MNNKSFVKQLEQKLPHWQQQGWLDQDGADAILSDSQSGRQKSHKLSIILAMMGVILLGAGAISFFAANWQGMSKLLKLSLLFSSMISAYMVSAYCLSADKLSVPRYPAMGHAFLLLGVLLFGNNIMLVAQIYHIDSHYPNGVLLWGIGALFTTILMRSEIVMILAVLLSLLWTGMEIVDFQQIHWQWLLFWSIASYFIVRYNFSLAAHFSQLSLFIWALMSLYSFSEYLSPVYLIQIYLLIGILLFLLARLLQLLTYQQAYNETLSFYAFIFSLIFLYILSFP
ncbi:MAG: DUF2157 domain-containing protein, partial [Thiotrichaceae bacterium]|nr:DUF2157 domain-containing protein [Thiotrichaceae bacterium]